MIPTVAHPSEFAGHVVLISGAARGQGASHARAFHDRGATVALVDVLDEEGHRLADELGERACFLHVDVREKQDWTAAVDAASARFGPVDVLVNNAGILVHGGVGEIAVDQFRNALAVNVLGMLFGIQAVAEGMRAAGGGAIVNVSSVLGKTARRGRAAYTATKWTVRGLTKAAAADLGSDGIRVNAVLPGIIETPMVDTLRTPAESVGANRDKLLIPRPGRASEVSAAVLFLASDRASYVTGADFVVDGGWTAG